MCTHVLQAHFKEKDVPLKYQVCEVSKVSKGALHTHCKKNYKRQADKPFDSRVSLSA